MEDIHVLVLSFVGREDTLILMRVVGIMSASW